QTEQGQGVGADFRVQAQGGEHQDAVVVLSDAEFTDGGDHAGGDVAVGLARGDAEIAGQHGAGQGHNHLVPHLEVVRTADDALHSGGIDAVNVQGLRGAFGHYTDGAPV